MEYERIQKPPQGGGGFSPGKLRNMLLGVEKQRKQEEDLEPAFTLRSQPFDLDESGGNSSDNCKDVDVVSVLPDCSTSTTADSLGSEMVSDRRLKDNNTIANTRARNQHDPSLDYDNGHDGMSVSSSIFEFQKGERAQQRVPLAPFSKPAPSKWDDAQKWIASPTSNRPKGGQTQLQGGQGVGSRKAGGLSYGSRQPSTKIVVEVPDQQAVASEEPDTKQMDTNQTKMESWGQKLLPWEADPYPTADSYGKPVLMIENSVGESAINLSRHSSSVAIQSAMTFLPPPSTARSVSMRDMGTEMTPIASQEPSRTGTPVRATTPIRSPTSSRPSTPGRTAPESFSSDPPVDNLDLNNGLSEKELQMKTRREIIALGTQLGKTNIAAWASKEDEDKDASTSLKSLAAEQQAKSVIETRATAWEEAEKTKYMARVILNIDAACYEYEMWTG
ncbi:Remorin family protein [Trema orientale]|uniref:Remorin family protein n=1 Tax=Trema orientale TaxID=63057 RepID=A0A2P5CIQ2_TREOI|nr:Remorin family protein [Trema orientale]